MEISVEKTKLMTISTEIKANRQNLETVTSFKYLGSVITDEGSNHEILDILKDSTDNNSIDYTLGSCICTESPCA